ncbi:MULTISPECIES: hypothetical protein [Burkholderia]|uniref:hypothetical protein n=1 Tax=Burkholderia TaxID=32008 RepID=UPI000AF38965|nr:MULTISPECIES: hypothetical protein [Burkholderia]
MDSSAEIHGSAESAIGTACIGNRKITNPSSSRDRVRSATPRALVSSPPAAKPTRFDETSWPLFFRGILPTRAKSPHRSINHFPATSPTSTMPHRFDSNESIGGHRHFNQ